MIEVMYDALQPKIPINVLAHAPKDPKLINEYKDAGVTSIAFNLEVFDREIFKKVCPGKNNLYGYDRWMRTLEESRDVFGQYKTFCGLVWGLEPAESTMAGNRYFLENGIAIASNIFHADPNSAMGKHPHPDEDFILKIAKHEQELFKEYTKAKTIFPVSMRSTVDWEAYRADFK